MVPELLRAARCWRVALLAAAIACVAAPAAAAEAPGRELAIPPHEAIYHATVRRVPVRAGLRLEQQNGRLYLYRSWVEPRGVFGFIRREFSETSLVLLADDGEILPVSYRRHDGVGGRHSDMRFDLAAGTLSIDYRGERTAIDWHPGIYDVLSLRLVLANDLAHGRLRDVYHLVDDRGRVEKIDVEVGGHEVLSTPLGELDTVRIEYHSERRDRHYRLWLAPELDSAMVRLEQHEEGRLRGSLSLVEYRRL